MDENLQWKNKLDNFEKAFLKMNEVIERNSNDEIIRMALIQSFEYTIELAWKTIKEYLSYEGFVVRSPKEVIRTAFQANIIGDAVLWFDALEMRNKASHAYDAQILEEASNFIINKFLPISSDLLAFFKSIKP